MSRLARFILATLCGLVLALIVHLVAVLRVPALGEQDAFSRLKSTMDAEASELLPVGEQTSWLPRPDPAVALGACAYDLGEGPVRISARTGALFQSLSFHAKGGGVFYAVTDRAAVRGSLELVVMTRVQLDEVLAREDEENPSQDVRIVSPTGQGLVIVRVLALFASQKADAEQAARSVSCTIDEEEEEDAAPEEPK